MRSNPEGASARPGQYFSHCLAVLGGLLLCAFVAIAARGADEGDLTLLHAGDACRFVLPSTGRELAVARPDSWQGNVRIQSPEGVECGVSWPHFLMNSQGKWLTDRVESEGMKLIEFRLLQSSGPMVGYEGTWQFRDYFTTSETHFAWYEPAYSQQVHLVSTRLRVLKDLDDIHGIWVEFMTRENSHRAAATTVGDGRVVTMDVSQSGPEKNMHFWDEQEIPTGGWIALYGPAGGRAGSAALIPLASSTPRLRPRVNNGHVDNIEIHLLDPRKPHQLARGQDFFLEYLFIAGPDQDDWEWVAPAAKRAREVLQASRKLLDGLHRSGPDLSPP